jgi:hypothetical protein
VSENIEEFIAFHNSHIVDNLLSVNLETLSTFASQKNIALEDISIEKHRMPFINWRTNLSNSEV